MHNLYITDVLQLCSIAVLRFGHSKQVDISKSSLLCATGVNSSASNQHLSFVYRIPTECFFNSNVFHFILVYRNNILSFKLSSMNSNEDQNENLGYLFPL